MKKLICLYLFFGLSVAAQNNEVDSLQQYDDQKIYRTTETDTRPEVVGGMYNLSMFISKNITLPDVHDRKITIFVGFVVEPDSTLSDLRFIHLTAEKLYKVNNEDASPDLDLAEEALYDDLRKNAINIVAAFDGKWIPATIQGRPVRCQYNYPIVINIE